MTVRFPVARRSGHPDITVVVPTRNEMTNAPRFVASLPRSVRLVVVDASSDNTPDLIVELRPDRTLVARHPGRIAEARHLGALLADTRWLVFTDADVAFAADYFDRLERRIAGAGAADAGWFGAKLSRDRYHRTYDAFTVGQSVANHLGVPAASGSNMVVRRDAYVDVGGFDLALSCNEDSELGWRLARAGWRFRFARDLVVHATDHRRLDAGRLRKTAHSLVRCTVLFVGLMPARWRSCDWGYWSGAASAGPASVARDDRS